MDNKTNTPIFDELQAKYGILPDTLVPDTSEYPTVQKDLGTTALEAVAPQPDATPKIEVTGFLSSTAKDMVDAMNNAITNGETTIHGDSFSDYIARAIHETGYITALDGKTLNDALSLYQSKRSKRHLQLT